MKPKIALLKSSLAKMGGAEKYAVALSCALEQAGAEVIILTSDTEERPGVLSCRLQSWGSARKVKEFDAFCDAAVKATRFDRVLSLDRTRCQTHIRASNGCHAAYLEKRGAQASFLKRLSFSVNPLHRTLLDIEKTSVEDPALQTLFTNSHMVKEELLSRYAIDPRNIEVVHNGVEWSALEPAFTRGFQERRELCQRLHLDPSSFHLLFIGHNYERKGLPSLLHALKALACKDVHLIVVGKEKRIDAFKHLASKLGLSSQVSFFGAVSDPKPFYQIADSIAIPSLYDPFANVTVEALAMGLFVISSKANGGHEVLTQESGAVIASLDETDSVATALQTALKHPKSVQSAQAIRNSVSHLDFSHQLKAFTDRLCNI
jgi:UDP-glucose:(heptosyl)LPS alpha-1,3-glucosyltransferase